MKERQKRSADEANFHSVDNVFDIKPIPVDMLPKAEQESLSRAAEADDRNRFRPIETTSTTTSQNNGEFHASKPPSRIDAALRQDFGGLPSAKATPVTKSYSNVISPSVMPLHPHSQLLQHPLSLQTSRVVAPEPDGTEDSDRLVIAEDIPDSQH